MTTPPLITVDLIANATFLAVEKYGWSTLTLVQVADEAGVPLTDLKKFVETKDHLLQVTALYIQEQTNKYLEEGAVAPETYEPDHAFDVIFARFEAAQPHKKAIERFYQDYKKDPLAALENRSFFLEVLEDLGTKAGLGFTGCKGSVRLHGFGLLYLDLFQTWLKDHTEDQSQTMSKTNAMVQSYIPCLYDPTKILDLIFKKAA